MPRAPAAVSTSFCTTPLPRWHCRLAPETTSALDVEPRYLLRCQVRMRLRAALAAAAERLPPPDDDGRAGMISRAADASIGEIDVGDCAI